jgi:hypothetical protein
MMDTDADMSFIEESTEYVDDVSGSKGVLQTAL